jgi:hypothetical protein
MFLFVEQAPPDFTKPHWKTIGPQWVNKRTTLVQQERKLVISNTLMEDDLKCHTFNFITKYWSDLKQLLNLISGALQNKTWPLIRTRAELYNL